MTVSRAVALSVVTVASGAYTDLTQLRQGQGFLANKVTIDGYDDLVQLGARPDYLVNELASSPLKDTLSACLRDKAFDAYKPQDWSIGHRGACLQFPEHTLESYRAALDQGAGIVECDVAVTSDGELVCRHAECDLQKTTNILATDLAAKCSTPFSPATENDTATVSCCTTDITLAEFQTLCGRMDAFNSAATTVAEYMEGTASWRTDLYADPAICPKVMTHAESVALIDSWGRKMMPELKTYSGSGSLTYDQARRKLAQEYIDAGVDASRVWLQSFNKPDIDFWILHYPNFGLQAVYLDGDRCDGTAANCPQMANFATYVSEGIKIIAPPQQQLVAANGSDYIASEYANAATAAGLRLITWTIERSGHLSAGGGSYWSTVASATTNNGDILRMLKVLHDAGVEGVFSDWPATTTFFANCVAHSAASAPASVQESSAQFGPRIDYLVNELASSPLKTQLQACLRDRKAYSPHDWSIGHRGACMQFPEHTLESYRAALVQGAGIVESDVAVTSDGELVCRHSECDLHTTTNILATDLAAKCSTPFTPATDSTDATASCCTTDLTLAEFQTLCGKMDAYNPKGTTVAEYLDGTANWRTDLYTDLVSCPKLMTHAESVALIDSWGRKMMPELKTYSGSGSLTYDQVRRQMAQAYIDVGVDASRVWLQSFNKPDVDFWILHYPSFGLQAVYLDNNFCDGTAANCPQIANFASYASEGLKIIAPPQQMLVAVNGSDYVASEFATAALDAGLSLATWTIERSGYLTSGGDWYWETVASATNNDGDIFRMLEALHEMGVVGVLSDWPATTTFFADCIFPTPAPSPTPPSPAPPSPSPAPPAPGGLGTVLISGLAVCLVGAVGFLILRGGSDEGSSNVELTQQA